MAPTRQQNVTSAQWSPNGSAKGVTDLTVAGSNTFGANVFTLSEQQMRLPKDVFKKLKKTLAIGAPLDSSLADSVAQAMIVFYL